ncbi:hypothetical protein [Glaciimonas sp. PCH181]|uniref:hypothetical protein n=1 Tax=Glaciimonas sp. PCH181 TaxID=2133943 RepID=UPI000D3C76E0|nr:hypothetical protein [Glaciimonas sp. PCH181]PUA19299.1 hypothetical protein C7W93_05325 [Glaciimonas sp. PCH181]
MIIEAQLPAITALLKKAANASDSVAFNALYALFPKNTPAQKVHATLEAACISLADFDLAIYSVVMVKKDTGLPGDGFFATYKAIHEAEYTTIAGDTALIALTLAQKQLMVNAEKTRVYAHAKA